MAVAAGEYIGNPFGNPQPGRAYSVYLPGTTNLASLFTDATLGTAAPNPANADSFGNVQFFAARGAYDIYSQGVTERVQAGSTGSASGSTVISQAAQSGAVAVDASTGDIQILNLTGNVSGITISNPTTGQQLILVLVQDATGSRTIAFTTTVKWAAATAPTWTTTASRKDIVRLIFDGTNWLEASRSLGVG